MSSNLEQELMILKSLPGLYPMMEGFEIEAIETVIDRLSEREPILESSESVVHVNRGEKEHKLVKVKSKYWICPNCSAIVGERFVTKSGFEHDQKLQVHCSVCGQHIKWG